MSREFRGWVPTITGNLSFSVLGTSKSPRKDEKAYRIVGGRRYTLAVQRRHTSDAVFGLYDVFHDREASFHFVMLCASFEDENHNANHGSVFVVDSREYWRFSHNIASLKHAADDEFERFFSFAFLGLQDAVDQKKAVRVNFSLDRAGGVSLKSEVDPKKQSDEGVIENQVYYFLRDISHRHQHHEATSDTILKCYRFDSLSPASTQRWKRETLYALYRWIIQQKRAQSLEAYINCKGVLAYACSFEELHVDRKSDTLVPAYNAKRTLESLDSSVQRSLHVTSPRFVAVFLNQVLPLLGLILALFGQVAAGLGGFTRNQSPSEQMERLHSLFELTVKYPIWVILMSFAPIVYFGMGRFLRGILMPRIRPMQRIAIAVGFWPTILSITLIVLALLSPILGLLL